MNHLSEEELVERYYNGAANSGQTGAEAVHLDECAECAAAFAALEVDLAAMRPVELPDKGEYYGEQMWARVEAALPSRSLPARKSRLALWRGLAFAAGCAALVTASFYGGRFYEHLHQRPVLQGQRRAPASSPQQKVVVVVLGDHLDRSERLLVELKHADPESPELVNPLTEEARALLAANRVFRDDAQREGDPALTQALSHLDQVLTEIANRRSGLDAAALERIKNQMNADGLLFEVRVLRSKNPHRNKTVRVMARGGAA
jgi:hypothetical protein